jgi:hypothetical protein
MLVLKFVFEAAFASGLAPSTDYDVNHDVSEDTRTPVWKAKPNSFTLKKE